MCRSTRLSFIAVFAGDIGLPADEIAKLRQTGIQHFRAGEYDAAVSCFRRTTESDCPTADDHRLLGLSLAQAGNREDSVAACKVATNLAPGSAEAQFALGHVLILASQPDAAIESLDKCLELDAFFSGGKEALLRALLASAELHRGVHDQMAEQRLVRALKLDKKNTEIFLALLAHYVRTEQRGKVISALRDLVVTKGDASVVDAATVVLGDDPLFQRMLRQKAEHPQESRIRGEDAPKSINKVLCPRCSAQMMDFAAQCPNCGFQTRQSSVFSPESRPRVRDWQQPTYVVCLILWILGGGWSFYLGYQGGISFYRGYVMTFACMQSLTGLLLLLGIDWISSTGKVVCYLSILMYSIFAFIAIGTGQWLNASTHFAQVLLAALLMYLIHFVSGD